MLVGKGVIYIYIYLDTFKHKYWFNYAKLPNACIQLDFIHSIPNICFIRVRNICIKTVWNCPTPSRETIASKNTMMLCYWIIPMRSPKFRNGSCIWFSWIIKFFIFLRSVQGIILQNKSYVVFTILIGREKYTLNKNGISV